MGYYVDLKGIGIDAYKDILSKTELIPSWKILGEDIDKNLNAVKKQGVSNLDELLAALKDKSKIKDFSDQSGLSIKYLEVLNRVVKGYKQKPNRIQDFTCISKKVVNRLEKVGIKNTLKLFDKVKTVKDRSECATETGIDKLDILLLARLTDLSRIRWVNHTFAFVLLESGYDSVKKVASANYKSLYADVKKLNDAKKIYNANIGEHDMKMVIESAQMLSIEVEF